MSESLAICMIVRDEEENLPRCLESVAGLDARLYITDTGSRDKTREIALSYEASLRDFAWINDFSAARNHSISGLSERWILNLDADDYFPLGEAARIRPYLENSPKAAFSLVYEVGEDSSPARGFKLFRNHLGIRYTGFIHEYFRNSLAHLPPGAVGDLPIRLKHSGYGPEQIARKIERNYPLLTLEWQRCCAAADRPQMLYIGKKLAESAFARGQPAGAENLLLGLLDSMLGAGETYHGDWQVSLLTHLLSYYHESMRDAEALSCCQRFEIVFRRHPLFWLYRGITRLRRGEFDVALADLDNFDRFVQTGKLDLAVPKTLLSSELFGYQGICHAALGRHRAAAALFAKAVASAPGNMEYKTRLKLALAQDNGSHLANETVGRF